MDSATEVGAVPFRPRIKNQKPVAMMTDNGLQSLTSDITKFAVADPKLSPKAQKKLSTH